MRSIPRIGLLALITTLILAPSLAELADDAPSGQAEMKDGMIAPETGDGVETEGCPFMERGETSSRCPAKGSEGEVRACPFSGKTDADSKCPYRDGSVRKAVGTYRT